MSENYTKFKLIIADLDGTLAKSKTPIDAEMSGLIIELLGYKEFAVISGGSYKQFQNQFLSNLQELKEKAAHLYLFPTCATSMYVMENGKWENLYAEILAESDKKEIFNAFDIALAEYGFKKPEKLYGELIEDRTTQITFSAFGQLAPLEVKSVWDPDKTKRKAIVEYLTKCLPEGFEARIGGATSIDITKKGIDKAYGIRKIEGRLGYTREEMLFIGDDLEEQGNDYPVKTTGVKCIAVKDPEETKLVMRQIITQSKGTLANTGSKPAN